MAFLLLVAQSKDALVGLAQAALVVGEDALDVGLLDGPSGVIDVFVLDGLHFHAASGPLVSELSAVIDDEVPGDGGEIRAEGPEPVISLARGLAERARERLLDERFDVTFRQSLAHPR